MIHEPFKYRKHIDTTHTFLDDFSFFSLSFPTCGAHQVYAFKNNVTYKFVWVTQTTDADKNNKIGVIFCN